jgi:hypothetical protein
MIPVLSRPPLPRRALAVLALAALGFGAGWAAFAGEDVGWDWRNYHEHNVWALLHGRRALDVMPSGFHSFMNALAYVPAYALRHGLPAPAGAMILGALQMLAVMLLVAQITRLLLREAATLPLLAAAVLTGGAGAMLLSEIGTSFIDIVTAAPVLGGVACLLCAPDGRRASAFGFAAGVLIGAATGLKLTNAVFAVAAAAAVLAGPRPLRQLLALGAGGVAGALAVDGVFAWQLWRAFGNPVFPLLNALFHAPEAADTIVIDTQFFPRSLGDALLYPWYFLAGGTRTTEVPMRDAGFALALMLLLVGGALRLLRRRALFTRTDLQLIVFVLVAYALWLRIFAIHRYIVALELLRGPLIVMLVVRILAVLDDAPGGWRRRSGSVALVLAAALILWVRPGDWDHRSWEAARRPVAIPPALAQPAAYVLLVKPIGYMAPRLPEGSRFYQLADIALPVKPGGAFDRRIRDGLAHPPPGGILALRFASERGPLELLAPYGLRLDPATPCVPLDSVWEPIEACRLLRD